MSKRGHAMVRPEDVDNQERGLDLANRSEVVERIEKLSTEPPPPEIGGELAELRRRLKAAQAEDVILAADTVPHCRDCFRRGWRAALREIES